MMTKVNKSFHETIIIILSVRLGSDESTSSSCLGKYIILSRCNDPYSESVMSDESEELIISPESAFTKST